MTDPQPPEGPRSEDRRPGDRRSEGRRAEDRRPEDRRPEDRRPEDRRPEDRRSESRRAEDRRPEDRRSEGRRRRGIGGWAILLLGTLAAAAMLPQFAFFVPIVATAWILARTGLLPGFLGHRHPGARIFPGPDARVTTVRALLEAEAPQGPDERELLRRLVETADRLGGARTAESGPACMLWRQDASAPPDRTSHLRLDDWLDVQEGLARGCGLVLATKSSRNGRRGVRRIEAMMAGDRALLEPLALDFAESLRRDGIEIVTSGWLRHAERIRATTRRPRART